MMKTVIESKTLVERLDAHINAMDNRVAALKSIKPTLEKVYSALSDDQKKANEILTGMGSMMRKMRRSHTEMPNRTGENT